MTRYIKLEWDNGWRSFDLDNPRCPYCGTDMVAITDIQLDRVIGRLEYGWINLFCMVNHCEYLEEPHYFEGQIGTIEAVLREWETDDPDEELWVTADGGPAAG